MFELKQYSLISAFVIGLLHVLEPCEDKAIASLYIAWAGKTIKRSLLLVSLYGLAMVLVNTILGLIAALAGIHYLQDIQPLMEMSAAVLTIIYGIFIIFHFHVFEIHCPIKLFKKVNLDNLKSALLFGLIRGSPLCPIEIAILLWSASSGSILYGTALMFVFALGTAISLIPFALGSKGVLIFAERIFGPGIKKLASLIVGGTMVVIGVILLLK